MKIIDKIKESIVEHTIEWILALLSPLFTGTVLALKSVIFEKLLPILSKQLLLVTLVVNISLLLPAIAYIVYLRRKVKNEKEPVLDEAKIRIMTFIANQDGPTKEQIISYLGMNQTYVEHHLDKLEEYKYIYVFSFPVISYSRGSKPATYHLTKVGKESIVRNRMIPA